MTIIVPRGRLVIARNQQLQTARFSIGADTESITLKIARPTTASPVVWGLGSRITSSIRIRANQHDFHLTGRCTGKDIRVDPIAGGEKQFYSLTYGLPYGFFGDRSGFARRLGEGKGTFDVLLELLLEGDAVDTQWSVDAAESPAPSIPFRSSVAFDAATAAQEADGDGVLSLTHTATGSDLAAFVGCGNSGNDLGSTTYDGNAMTELWDLDQGATNVHSAGYAKAGIASGAVTVTNTLIGGATDHHILHCMSMTGVDQSTPVGTAVTTGPGTSTTPSVDASDAVTGDLVCDFVYCGSGATPAATAGANQTQRLTTAESPIRGASSTQAGADGGVMSQTLTGASLGSVLGAVAFKQVAAGGAVSIVPIIRQNYRNMGY